MATWLVWISCLMVAAAAGQQVNNMAVALAQHSNFSSSSSPSSASCSSVRLAYRSRGFNDRDAPQQPIAGNKLRFCGRSATTCCTESMETKLMEASRHQYEMVIRETTANLLTSFTSRAKKFDEFFRELLENSKRDFHDMFKRTYGILYEQNSEVFTDLFRDLEDYYSRGKLDLEHAMDLFFTALYQRMFTVLNAQYRFDDKYLVCVNTHMKELKPFGDVPKKLSVQVKRSFVATRTFTQALVVGRDVIAKIQTLEPTSECHKAVMRMTTCPVCQGQRPELKPCPGLCLTVLKTCLAHHAELGLEWDNYVDALMKVADRLLGPFNIELVVDPIDIKISDAIMNFQENGVEISQKVYKGCGQPRLGKRSAGSEINFEGMKFDRGGSSGGGGGARPTTAAGTSLDRLVRDIKQKVKASRNFWSKMPQTVCAHDKMASLQSTLGHSDCWNGQERTTLTDPAASGPAVEDLPGNARPNSLVNEQIFSLRLMTNKLENAYNGMDVEWDDAWNVGGGSGSGSGSGDDEDDSEEEDEDDDEDRVRPKHPHSNVPASNTPIQPNRATPPRFQVYDDGIEFSAGTNLNGNNRQVNVPVTTVKTTTPSTTTSSAPTGGSATAGGQGSSSSSLGRTKALTRYLVPIVVMWIGNMF